MEKKTKILNDPVYGFVGIPYGILFDLVEHPYFQRLRNIKQVSLTHYVYPGALHTRFHHAIGALHLMQQAVDSLRAKGVAISEQEAEAVMIAILLHDIGHGPFSHTLEHTLIGVNHETLSLLFMQRLNDEFQGKLSLAIEVFTGRYPKPFLHQLVSGQLDMDRLDYLNRDSYFTGVAEGVIGYDRIIKMLNVVEGRLVVEQKGIYSVERFLTSRRIMYWQVYLHKTVVAAEQMLRLTLQRARKLSEMGQPPWAPPALEYFLIHRVGSEDFLSSRNQLLDCFAALDDTDISAAVKTWQHHPDALLSYLSYGLVNRRLFRLEFSNDPFDPAYVDELREAIRTDTRLPRDAAAHLVIQGQETNSAYTLTKEEIMVWTKYGEVVPMSTISDFAIAPRSYTKFFLCYPKEIAV
ncbi:HD domain-containing protein [Lewinella sp. IMCC34191]|uniref:HD domain-containing protein n=1 Tax=Lewinella sp. IMCC34191 TaxID=2259172 RepID=UPI000E27C09C|nr:HD domain-containing protein [Lewinella sp. IMCC34191]